MKEDQLRLRLVVRRHALPEVRVVFNVLLEHDPNISNLLEQINEVIPLESNDWGLEDYAVELRDHSGHAFECMHFTSVSRTLERDEEVFIRPLFAGDRKKRRLSGRDQISTDGKHLIDGIAFGRPRLRTPRDRPTIDIPPLKRRRVTYDDPEELLDDEDEESGPFLLTEHGEEPDPASVTVSATFEDADEEDEDEEDEDEDFQDDGGDDNDDDMPDLDGSDLEDELRGLRAENAELFGGPVEPRGPLEDADKPQAHGNSSIMELEDLDKLTALRAAFPDASLEACERVLFLCNNDERKAYKKLHKSFVANRSLADTLSHKEALAVKNLPPPGKADAESEADNSEVESVDALTKHYDEYGFPSGTILNGTASKQMAKRLRESGQDIKLPKRTVFEDAGSGAAASRKSEMDDEESASDSESSSDTDSSSDSESDSDSGNSSSSSESSPEGAGANGRDGDTSSSDDEESSDSDSDDGPEIASSKRVPISNRQAASSKQAALSSSSNSSDSESDSDDESDSEDSGSDSGSEAESKGASNRGASVSSSSSDDSGDSSSDSSSDESSHDEPKLHKGDMKTSVTEQSPRFHSAKSQDETPEVQIQNVQAPAPGKGSAATQKRNARRRTVKAALRDASGGFSVPLGASDSPVASAPANPAIAARKAALLKKLETESGGQPAAQATVASAAPDPPHEQATVSPEVSQPTGGEPGPTPPSQRRMKLDLGAGRRMLFASLGLRNPKTKADEDKIRVNLMKDVRPLVNPRISDEHDNGQSATTTGAQPLVEDNPEAWREKITYRAVECCHEGVALSEPPFPFVQRWDPQQQRSSQSQRGGRGKRKQHYQYGFDDAEEMRPSTKKPKFADATNLHDANQATTWETEDANFILNYDDIPDQPNLDPTPNAPQSTGLQEPPPLPEDISSLPPFQLEQAFPGMAITWNQYLLSQATNWEPQLLRVSGTIVDIEKETGSLGIMLAQRDRPAEHEKEYDEHGNRVYAKFEGPDMDDGSDEEGDGPSGYQQLSLSELIDPRILQQPSSAAAVDASPALGITVDDSQPAIAIPDAQAPDNHANNRSCGLSTSQIPGHQAGITPPEALESMVPDTYPVSVAADRESSLPSPLGQTSRLPNAQQESTEMIIDSGSRDGIGSISGDKGLELDSPSQQLEAMSEAAAVASQRSSQAPSVAPHLPNTPDAVPPVTPSKAPSSISGSQPQLLGPDSAQDTAEDLAREFPPVVYPKLEASQVSSHSTPAGRQPDPDLSPDLGTDSIGLLDDTPDVSDYDEATSRPRRSPQPAAADRHTPPKQGIVGAGPDGSPSSVNSFPSLSEVWATARSSRNTQSPAKSAVVSAGQAPKSDAQRDLEYEEAMRRLEHGDGSSDYGDGVKAVLKTEGSSQPAPVSWPPQKLAKSPPGSANQTPGDSTSTTVVRKVERNSSPGLSTVPRKNQLRTNSHAIPPGSQAISLDSSSPEPDDAGNDAGGSICESSGETRVLPAVRGWKAKQPRSGINGLTAVKTRRSLSRPPSLSVDRPLTANSKPGKGGNSKRKASFKV